ncbi:sulfotransferase domain-containing protein [Allopontixanthobacter sp.]|uniref:sulfotransferase domain-containing protein n=1 Tax=Allopontixanthobacter sp. TaxID=2906452 RepID=UPI002ABAD13B|nr:sulfotransferase domain-containing protein [Allopontixanthobacter sp.]MDZ4306720.1 sulfotransferase domain-containing protein [Allopontixanthobacter sp.]
MLIRKPERTIRTWHTDSRIWDSFELRAGDIIVCTPPKTGTTWIQRIVGMLLAQSAEPRQIMEEQPWLDARFIPQAEVAAALSAVEGRRGLKTHSPLTALPLHDDVLYINVARDPRDAVMSFHNHSMNLSDDFLAARDQDGLADPFIAAPYPRALDDQRAFFRRWLRDPKYAPFDDFTIAEFIEIETSFWEARERPHVLLVHYNDLKADREGEMRRIAQFCGIATPEPLFHEMVEAAGFASMKRAGTQLLGSAEVAFKGGADAFLHKGTNERWRSVLSDEDLADYRAALQAGVTPDLTNWLEHGRLAAFDPTPVSTPV